ncbi:MAG: D-sedoheptulose-7-phosphate isomerase [Phycisphaerales bacterium]
MELSDTTRRLETNIAGAKAAMDATMTLLPRVHEAAKRVAEALRGGNKLLVCGNGGSAAEASHLAGEIVGRYKKNRTAYPCICLSDSPGVVTCIGNDFGFDQVFARQVEAFGQSGDVLIVFTSSGNSANIVRALEAAKGRGVTSVALLGGGGGKCAGLADIELVAPGGETARVQEVHLMLLHTLCDLVEDALGHR